MKLAVRPRRRSIRTAALLTSTCVLVGGALATAGVIAVQPAGSSTAGQDWPVYGRDLANSRTSTAGPAKTAPFTLSVAWRDDFTDGDFTGTPVVSQGVVYVGSNGGVVRAIQAKTTSAGPAGRVLWSAKMTDAVNGSLAVDPRQGLVYVPVAHQGGPAVVALRTWDGRQVWSRTLDTSTDADVYGSPTIVPLEDDDTMVLQGVSAVSGDPNSPLRGSVSALDGKSGKVLWKTFMVPPNDNGGAVWSTPAVDLAHRAVFVGTGNAYSGSAAPTTDAIVKLDLLSGRILNSFQATSNDVFSSSTPGLDFDFGASPNLLTTATETLVGEGQKEGTYWMLNSADMAPQWHTQIGTASVVGGILGSTAIDGVSGQVVGPNSVPGYVWSLTAAAGTPGFVTAAPGDPAHLSPVAVSNGLVYSVASGSFLEVWDETTGAPMFEYPLNPSPPAGGADTVSLGSGVSVAEGLVVADTGSQSSNGSVVALAAG